MNLRYISPQKLKKHKHNSVITVILRIFLILFSLKKKFTHSFVFWGFFCSFKISENLRENLYEKWKSRTLEGLRISFKEIENNISTINLLMHKRSKMVTENS